MRRAAVVLGLVLAVAGCGDGGDDAAPTTSAGTATSTSPAVESTAPSGPSRDEVAAAMVDALSLGADELSWYGADPEALVVLGATYCADVERDGPDGASSNLERGLARYIRRHNPHTTDPRSAPLLAQLSVSDLAEVAEGMLCPDARTGGYLPPS